MLASLFATLIVGNSCQLPRMQAMAAAAHRIQEESVIQETVIRHLLVELKRNPKWAVYFLALGEKDPTKSFLEKFENHEPVVKPVSESKQDTSSADWALYSVRDKTTSAIGVIVHVEPARFDRKDKATIEVDYHSGGRNALWYVYSLAKWKGRWHIKGRKMTAIS